MLTKFPSLLGAIQTPQSLTEPHSVYTLFLP